MIIQIRSQAPVLLERFVHVGLISDSDELHRVRKLCWGMGAMTSIGLNDANITHILVPSEHSGGDIFVDSVVAENAPVCVCMDWLLDCSKLGTCVDESKYIARNVVLKPHIVKAPTVLRPSSRSLAYRSTDVPIADNAKANPSRSAISRRRSDISSVPLRPNGVFQGVELSLLGWNDARTEASLSYQITTNGGLIVPFCNSSQYACVCSDGSRPTRRTDVRLVSQRWINDCLASGTLVDPCDKITYTPSSAQLPLLMMKNLCLYLTEKDTAKLESIQDIAKLCGIRCVVTDGARLSTVTHFIFHDLVSFNRRRDLIPLAKKSNKFVVSLDWLKELYIQGIRPDESQYDPSVSMFVPAIADSADESRIVSPCLPDEPQQQENTIVWENKNTIQLNRQTQ